MDLLYFQPNLPFPGASGNTRCYEFARQWAADGHRVSVIAGRAGKSGKEIREGVEIHWVKAEYHHNMGFARRVFSWAAYLWGTAWIALRLPRPDVILAYSPPLPTLWLAALLGTLRRIPSLAEVADVWPDVPIGMGIVRNRGVAFLLRSLSRWAYRRAGRVFAFSEDMIPLLTAYGVPEDRIRVVYNGVSGLPRPTHLADNRTGEVLYAGTIGIANDLGQIVRAAALLQARGRTDIRFTLLGAGNDLQRVQTLIQSLDLHNITLLPPVPYPEAMERIGQAAIGLGSFAPFPVLESNGSSKFCDYLAAGTPVVLNYRGWQGRLVEAHGCGLAVPQGDIPALAAAIEALADDPALRMQMGLRGRALAQEKFDRTQLAAAMLAEIRTFMASH